MILHFLKDHRGKYRAYDEIELHDLIMEDDSRGYFDTSSPVEMKPMLSWCAPVTEIANVIDKFDNRAFKDDVCRTVLNRCSYFYGQGYRFKKDAETAVWKCFAELTPDLGKNHEARENYIDHFINVIIRDQGVLRNYSGDFWHKFCQNFYNKKVDTWKGLYHVTDFSKWAEEVEKGFIDHLEEAEKKGLFEKEEAERFDYWANMIMRAAEQHIS